MSLIHKPFEIYCLLFLTNFCVIKTFGIGETVGQAVAVEWQWHRRLSLLVLRFVHRLPHPLSLSSPLSPSHLNHV